MYFMDPIACLLCQQLKIVIFYRLQHSQFYFVNKLDEPWGDERGRGRRDGYHI